MWCRPRPGPRGRCSYVFSHTATTIEGFGVVLCDAIIKLASSVLRRRTVRVAIMTGPWMLHPWRDRFTDVNPRRPSEERLRLLLLFPRAARTEGTAPRPPEAGSHGGRPPPAPHGSPTERAERSGADEGGDRREANEARAARLCRRLEGATGPRPEEDGALFRAEGAFLFQRAARYKQGGGWGTKPAGAVGVKTRRAGRVASAGSDGTGERWPRMAYSPGPARTARQGVGREGLGPPLPRSL